MTLTTFHINISLFFASRLLSFSLLYRRTVLEICPFQRSCISWKFNKNPVSLFYHPSRSICSKCGDVSLLYLK